MTISREQFIDRLKEVGAKCCSDDAYSLRHKKDGGIDIYIYETNFIAQEYYEIEYCDEIGFKRPYLYSFDELEQFLVDKGIVEPKFDGREYLISQGMAHGACDTYSYPEKILPHIYFEDSVNEIVVAQNDNLIWATKGITKESCDKAIGLIKYLESIE